MSPYPCPWTPEIRIFTHLNLKFNPPRCEVGWGCCAHAKEQKWSVNPKTWQCWWRCEPVFSAVLSRAQIITEKVHIEQIEPVGRFRTFLVNTDTTIMQKGPLADSKSYIPSASFHLFLATFSDELCHPPVIVEPPTTGPLRPQRWMACSGHSPLWVGLPAKKSLWRPKGWKLLKLSPVSPTWSSILY